MVKMDDRRRIRRILALGTVAAVALVPLGCAGGDEGDAERAAADQEPTTTTAPPTTTAAPTTTAPPTTLPPTTLPPTTTAPPPPAEPEVLERGTSGPRTQALQQRLVDLRLDPGPVDGDFGGKTQMAVWAFQKAYGLPVDGLVTPQVWQAMQTTSPPAPMRPDGPGDRVEIDLARQVLFLYDAGQLRLITHISTGTGQHYCDNGHCGVAVTPTGDYRVQRRIAGWRQSVLGMLYNPLYFNGGIAIHGAPSVPAHPASHGCVRIPMHISGYFPDLVANGEPVYVI
jgi:peptidoglycan hydrolase-like protein with peptidoglycan-binding domain